MKRRTPGAGGVRRVPPRKRFGQHFLEPAWADKVVGAIEPDARDRFLEIGAGPGALTLRLAPRVAHLTAIEVDRDLAARLRRAAPPNTTVVEADVLEAELVGFTHEGPLRVAGNLPYNISSPILFKLLNAARSGLALVDATLMLQLEVAERLTAPVGTHEYGVLTILAGLYADVRRLLVLPPGAFRPVPRVRSAVVRLAFRPSPVHIVDEGLLARLVRALFTQRRKTLLNSLRPFAATIGRDAAATLSISAIDPQRRPETLQLTELARLVHALASTDR
jgi:16S rRNA (adenine1518-N6/adenine1519-N6)-dimethyltransferase